MRPFLEGLKALGPLKLAAMGGAALAVLALIAGIALSAGSAPMALLYGGLSLQDSANVVGVLQGAHIPYQLQSGGQTVLVPAPAVDAARLMLAQKNLPADGSAGYELFDHQNALTGSDFLDNINETRALDGELERTIGLIRGVRAARVQVVLPHLQPFAQNPDPAQASVMLTLATPRGLDQESVNAILDLVAAAVPGLKPEHIAVADNRGDVLAAAGRPGDAANAGGAGARAQAEQRLAASVQGLLDQALGAGHAHVAAAVSMNFDNVDQTSQSFDPNGQVPVSQQSSTDTTQNVTAPQGVTVQNNLPNPGGANAPQPGSSSARKTETTNFDVGTTTRHLVQNTPTISRISLAVLIDEQPETDAKGKTTWQKRPQAEIDAITALAKNAIGFNAARGDTVEVQSLPFAGDAVLAPPHESALARIAARVDIYGILRLLVIAAAGIVALLAVLRPAVLRIAAAADPARVPAPAQPAALAGANAAPRLPAPEGAEDEAMVDLTQVEGKLRMSSLKRIADISESNPEETLSLIRSWLDREPAPEAP